MLNPAATRDLELLLDHYPDAAEPLIQAAKEGRLCGAYFLKAEQPPCGCILGITVFSVKHAKLSAMVASDLEARQADGVYELGDEYILYDSAAAILAHRIREELLGSPLNWFRFEDHSVVTDTPGLISAIENWQESRLQAQAERRLSDA